MVKKVLEQDVMTYWYISDIGDRDENLLGHKIRDIPSDLLHAYECALDEVHDLSMSLREMYDTGKIS